MFPKMKCLAAIISILAFVNIAATVPASVLAQNTELDKETNTNNNNNLKNQVFNNHDNNNNNFNNKLTKVTVKRSSNNGLELPSDSSSASALNSVLDKKSSPEVVPAVFNSPSRQFMNTQSDQEQELQLQQQYQQQRQRQQQQQQQQPLESESTLKEAGLSGLSALTADITAELQQQKLQQLRQQQLQQQQQQQQWQEEQGQNYYETDSNYNNEYESSRNLMKKRGINTVHPYVYGLGGIDGTLQRADNYDTYIPEYYTSETNNFNNNNNNNNNNNKNNNNNNILNPYNYESGLLTDDIDVGNVMYNDLDDYAQTSRVPNYRSKAYDNLQSILNSETYAEPQGVQSSPVYMPLQYDNGRYYGGAIEPIDRERNKRPYQDGSKFNNNKYADIPLKRDAKLSPADMLALVALLEAGDRARNDNDEEPAYIPPVAETYNPHRYYNSPNSYEYAQVLNSPMEEMNFNAANSHGAWVDPPTPNNGYYGLPINVDTLPKYEIRNNYATSANSNRYNNKRFIVAKKKRSPSSQTSYNYSGKKFF